MTSPIESLERLREGNRRYASGEITHRPEGIGAARRAELAPAQNPFAVILGCSDSRVPPEIVFDQGLGDLFVIRIAGNVAGHPQIGSVEFAVEQLGTRLVVVLGHLHCGAVQAAIEQLRNDAVSASEAERAIIDPVKTAILPLMAADPKRDPETLAQLAVRANVAGSVDDLRRGSSLLDRMIQSGEIVLVGSQYCVESGAVEFFDQTGS